MVTAPPTHARQRLSKFPRFSMFGNIYALVAAGLLVMEDELKRCLSPRLGRVKLYWHP
jgi:hypothetical protein